MMTATSSLISLACPDSSNNDRDWASCVSFPNLSAYHKAAASSYCSCTKAVACARGSGSAPADAVADGSLLHRRKYQSQFEMPQQRSRISSHAQAVQKVVLPAVMLPTVRPRFDGIHECDRMPAREALWIRCLTLVSLQYTFCVAWLCVVRQQRCPPALPWG